MNNTLTSKRKGCKKSCQITVDKSLKKLSMRFTNYVAKLKKELSDGSWIIDFMISDFGFQKKKNIQDFFFRLEKIVKLYTVSRLELIVEFSCVPSRNFHQVYFSFSSILDRHLPSQVNKIMEFPGLGQINWN